MSELINMIQVIKDEIIQAMTDAYTQRFETTSPSQRSYWTGKMTAYEEIHRMLSNIPERSEQHD